MVEPSRRSSRLVLAAGIGAALALGAGGFVLGRASRDAPATSVPASIPAPAPAQPPVPEKTVQLPGLQPPLGRADLIAVAAAAADAFASGTASPASSALAGRRFELRIPFGCAGNAAASSSEPLRWIYDEAAEALRVRAEPTRWAPEEWMTAKTPGPPVEAVQGFWIARPWTSSEACPPFAPGTAAAASPQTPPVETLGIAEFFTAGSSRVTRRDGQAFEAVEKVAPGALNISRGLRLRLRGQVTTAPDGRSILCRLEAGPDRRPSCLVAVAFDEVTIENPATAETIATWDVSRGSDAQSGSPSQG